MPLLFSNSNQGWPNIAQSYYYLIRSSYQPSKWLDSFPIWRRPLLYLFSHRCWSGVGGERAGAEELQWTCIHACFWDPRLGYFQATKRLFIVDVFGTSSRKTYVFRLVCCLHGGTFSVFMRQAPRCTHIVVLVRSCGELSGGKIFINIKEDHRIVEVVRVEESETLSVR